LLLPQIFDYNNFTPPRKDFLQEKHEFLATSMPCCSPVVKIIFDAVVKADSTIENKTEKVTKKTLNSKKCLLRELLLQSYTGESTKREDLSRLE
jgi:hypothetical protein